ncbi:MAG: MBOAT family O-acyltransferase [Imperialibacter sp.]|uniref:MBOAT family O-acyltransferase n=1 Tax=Imperialibacter sp. TaxID=2038411 RepID=UPI0032EFFDD3
MGIDRARVQNNKRLILFTSIFFNLGVLGFFKYYNFFIDSWIQAWANFGVVMTASTLNIVLPVGISFYTFQTMSYTIDIYRNQLQPTRSFLSFFTFVAYFPQLVAGPIERAAVLLPQITKRRSFSYTSAIQGIHLIVWGLFKKVAVGDNLGVIVDGFYGNVGLYSQSHLYTIFSIIFYSFQIYCDFSGYSDIAIGTSKLFGIDLNTNFNRPYFSQSFSEFWRRWHISLSSWLRDYLYIPLGGNRKGQARTYGNLFITMALGGLWHGASFNFIIWGALHGAFLAIERMFKPLKIPFPAILNRLFVFAVVSLAWIPFRSLNLTDTVNIFASFFKNGSGASLPLSYFDLAEGVLLTCIVVAVDLCEERGLVFKNWFTVVLLAVLLIFLGNWRALSFIYFQF